MSDRFTENVADLLSKWEAPSTEKITIVVAGKHESGKTALVSALCDKPVVKEENIAMLSVNKSHEISDYDITVWDACGMFETSRSRRSDLAIKEMKRIKCLNEKKKVLLIYTIPINQPRFLRDRDQNVDINCMKRLTMEFGEQIWKHSIIVCTFVNEDYEEKKEDLDGDNDEEKQKAYILDIEAFKKRVRDCLKQFVLSEHEAIKIPIEPAGYIRDSMTLKSLEYDSDGKSWDLNVWCKLAERAPENIQHKLLAYCFYKNFQSPLLYFDSYRTLVKIHGQLYSNVACTVEESEGCRKLGLAYSYLRLLKNWFDKYYEQHESKLKSYQLQGRKLKCSSEASDRLQFWESLKTYINLVVTGANHSGKTSLINSMLYQKCEVEETPNNDNCCISEYKSITCLFQECSLYSLQQVQLDDAALLLVCIMLTDTEENMTRILTPVAAKNPSNLMVVLTFSEVDLSGHSWNELIQRQTESIKHILHELNVSSAVVESLRVAPASYHSELTITNDPSNTNWIMNVWLNAIASAKVSSQSAMAVFVNHFIYGGQRRKNVLPCHKILYREHLLQILYNMTLTHSIKYH